MGAVTYPNEKVIDYIGKNFIALRLANDAEPYAGQFTVKWTPKVLILDALGKAHQQTTGFLPPEDFVPFLELGLAMVDFDLDCLEDCRMHLDNILASHPESLAAPEALYYLGVMGYKTTGDGESLKTALRELQNRYPDSEWARKARPYRLL